MLNVIAETKLAASELEFGPETLKSWT